MQGLIFLALMTLAVASTAFATGVAVHGKDVYVLEYTHANQGSDRGWVPRVRKLASDGKVTTLVTEAEGNIPRVR